MCVVIIIFFNLRSNRGSAGGEEGIHTFALVKNRSMSVLVSYPSGVAGHPQDGWEEKAREEKGNTEL